MRKDWKKRVCLILCLALCLGGSAMASEGKVAMGRYIEIPIKLPFEGNLCFAYAGGAIYYTDENGDTLFYCTDLDNWEVNHIGHDEHNPLAQGYINGLTVSTDGTLWLSNGALMLNEEGYPYLERVRDGKSERVQLDQKLATDMDRLILCALPSGELLGLSGIEAYRFSADGTTKQRYAVSGGEAMAVYENEVAVCSTRDSLITILDIKSGQVLRTLPLPSGVSYGLSQIGYDVKGALYYVGPNGLYQSNAGSTMMMQIADGRLMTVGKPSIEARALLFDQGNNPVIAYSQGGGISLIQYRYDENMTTEPNTILSVFTLYDSSTLHECASLFQLKYPDVMVDITVALPKGTALTCDDAIRTLNTEILAGKGSDVLVLDGLPVQSYIDKGVLQNLSPVVQPMIDSGALIKSVASAFDKNGTISAVPTRFLMPSIWGEVEGLTTLEDMAAWAQANPDSMPYYATDNESLIGTFYLSCAPAWFTEGGRLDEAKIEAFLISVSAVRGAWTFETIAHKTGMDAGFSVHEWRSNAGVWNPYQPPAGEYTTEEMNGCEFLAAGVQRQLPYLLRSVDTTTYPNGAMASHKNSSFVPLPGQAEDCFVPMLMLGASKGAANSDMAMKFIGYLLDEESQNIDLMEGFQVNVKALDAAQSRGHTLFGVDGGNNEVAWRTTWLNPDQQKKLRAMIESLSTPVVPDFTLYQMIVQESTPFFEGQISAKQAAQNVCAKANAYLSE